MCVSKSIGLALFFFVFEGIFQVQALQGAYIGRGDLTEGFLCYEFGGGGFYLEGLIFGLLWYTDQQKVVVDNEYLSF